MWLLVFLLVLALHSNQLKSSRRFRSRSRVADELKHVALVAAQIPPSQDGLAGITQVNPKPQFLVKQENPLVLVRRGSRKSTASFLPVFFVKLFAFLVGALDDQLILKLLSGAANESGGVLEDEFAVSFD